MGLRAYVFVLEEDEGARGVPVDDNALASWESGHSIDAFASIEGWREGEERGRVGRGEDGEGNSKERG